MYIWVPYILSISVVLLWFTSIHNAIISKGDIFVFQDADKDKDKKRPGSRGSAKSKASKDKEAEPTEQPSDEGPTEPERYWPVCDRYQNSLLKFAYAWLKESLTYIWLQLIYLSVKGGLLTQILVEALAETGISQ